MTRPSSGRGARGVRPTRFRLPVTPRDLPPPEPLSWGWVCDPPVFRAPSPDPLRTHGHPREPNVAPDPSHIRRPVHTQRPALPHRRPRRIEHRPEHDLPQRSLFAATAPPLSALPSRLPRHLQPLLPLHQPLLQHHPARLRFVRCRRHGHPQGPQRRIPRLHPIRLRPTLHQHPPPPPPRLVELGLCPARLADVCPGSCVGVGL